MPPVRTLRPAATPPALVLVVAFVVGAVPSSNLIARRVKRVDLRRVGTGTVSGTALYREAGFGPLVAAGLTDIAKGAVGPLLAGRQRPALAAAAGGAGVAGHNWSPFLGGAGGRGLSPAMGALLVVDWTGTVMLLAGLAAGRLARHTGLGAFAAQLAVLLVLTARRGPHGALAAAAIVAPMLGKRMLGNAPPPRRRPADYLHRLLYDSDPESASP